MPYIHCEIRRGRGPEQLSAFMRALADAVEETTGIPSKYVVVQISESPGFNFLEFGEHDVDYGPDEEGAADLAAEAQLRRLGVLPDADSSDEI